MTAGSGAWPESRTGTGSAPPVDVGPGAVVTDAADVVVTPGIDVVGPVPSSSSPGAGAEEERHGQAHPDHTRHARIDVSAAQYTWASAGSTMRSGCSGSNHRSMTAQWYGWRM